MKNIKENERELFTRIITLDEYCTGWSHLRTWSFEDFKVTSTFLNLMIHIFIHWSVHLEVKSKAWRTVWTQECCLCLFLFPRFYGIKISLKYLVNFNIYTFFFYRKSVDNKYLVPFKKVISKSSKSLHLQKKHYFHIMLPLISNNFY